MGEVPENLKNAVEQAQELLGTNQPTNQPTSNS